MPGPNLIEEHQPAPSGPGEPPSPGPDGLGFSSRCSQSEFDLLRRYLRRTAGIHIPDQKVALLEGRLAKRLRVLGFRSYRQYYRHLIEHDESGAELSEFVNALTTNKTGFFRESAHFEAFSARLLPERVAARAARGEKILRIWSAACSSGEEPYSLAIKLRERFLELDEWDVRILATDIDSATLDRARRGIYTKEKLEEVSLALRQKYFEHVPDVGREPHYKVVDSLKEFIRFKRFNLFDNPYPFSRPFDIIFCRNVMIYFDTEVREQVVRNMTEHLAAGGYLIIGHAESLLGVPHALDAVGPTLYRKPG